MKQIIFVCLLSLSVCLSQQNTPLETAAKTAPVISQQNSTAPETKTNETKQPEHPQGTATELSPKPSEVIAGSQNATSTNATQTQTATTSNETSTKTNDNKPIEKNTATETKPTDSTVKPVDPPKQKNETKPATPAVPTTNGTDAAGTDSKKNETTTPKGENVTPTKALVEAKSRAFDGPSFIGGIILTLGLLAIGFMGFKYYKNQTERNYHTL